MLTLPTRTEKNRSYGLTSIHDVHLTIAQTETILNDYSMFLDYAKFGVGTAYVAPNLKERIILYKKFNVIPYFGGTLFEKFYSEGKLDDFLIFMSKNDINTIEISTGTIDILLDVRMELVSKLCKDFNVLTEVGSKDAELVMAPSLWINEINSLLQAGANYVITEGRNSGTAGIYRTSGEMRTGLVEDIILQCDVNKIIFEAPNSSAQMHFINKIGANVNLGNIKPEDLLLLETQRVGLRSETFNVKK